MNLRPLTVSVLLAGLATAGVATAQGEKQAGATAGDQGGATATQEKGDQDKPKGNQGKPAEAAAKPLDAAAKPLIDTTSQLERSLQIAERERDYLERVYKSGGLLSRFKMTRTNARDLSKRFVPVVHGPAVPVKKTARLLGDTEKDALKDEVLFTVESMPVTQQEYDATLAYLKSFPQADGVAPVETLAIASLIERKAPQAASPETAKAAAELLEAISRKLAEGGDFADLARQFSHDQESGAKGGQRGYEARKELDAAYGNAAFGLKVGQTSGVIATRDGFQILKVLGTKRGETPDQDKILTAHILRRYDSEKSLAEVAQRVAGGQIDLAFRTDELRKFAPAQFK